MSKTPNPIPDDTPGAIVFAYGDPLPKMQWGGNPVFILPDRSVLDRLGLCRLLKDLDLNPDQPRIMTLHLMPLPRPEGLGSTTIWWRSRDGRTDLSPADQLTWLSPEELNHASAIGRYDFELCDGDIIDWCMPYRLQGGWYALQPAPKGLPPFLRKNEYEDTGTSVVKVTVVEADNRVLPYFLDLAEVALMKPVDVVLSKSARVEKRTGVYLRNQMALVVKGHDIINRWIAYKARVQK